MMTLTVGAKSFDLAAHRVWGRLVRRFPTTQLTVSDVKHRWYWQGRPWVKRDRFGKLSRTT